MLTRRCAIHRCVPAGLLFLMSLGGQQLGAPTAIYAQADSSGSPQRATAGPSAPAAAGTPAARELFRQQCVKCHGTDGKGGAARGPLPEIPDFTDAAWQRRRSEAQLRASILDGKGPGMPAGRGKIGEEQARGLVAYVRAFAPTTRKPRQEEQQGPDPASFDERYRRLQEELDELKRQFRELSKESTGGTPSKPSESRQDEVARLSAAAAAETPAVRELFQQHCVKCHAADGTGGQVRDRLPEVPDFTDATWQGRRSGAQLLASILDGKGKEMPPFREKISAEQARGLVAYVRAFAPTPGKSRQEKKEPPPQSFPGSGQQEEQGPARAEPGQSRPTRGFFEKLIRWLGEFHPPAVHFPIALLTAAAVAELLRMATGKAAFDAAARYCVWFGTLTAVAAGVLGWFVGGFRLANASVVLITHSSFGTATVACAGLVLVLSEGSRRPDRRRTRMWFRVVLLVVAALVLVTGFFGGAVVFGLEHYTWPP